MLKHIEKKVQFSPFENPNSKKSWNWHCGSFSEVFRHLVGIKLAVDVWAKIKSQNKYFSVSDLL